MDVLFIQYMPHSSVQILFETFFNLNIFKKKSEIQEDMRVYLHTEVHHTLSDLNKNGAF